MCTERVDSDADSIVDNSIVVRVLIRILRAASVLKRTSTRIAVAVALVAVVTGVILVLLLLLTTVRNLDGRPEPIRIHEGIRIFLTTYPWRHEADFKPQQSCNLAQQAHHVLVHDAACCEHVARNDHIHRWHLRHS
jgi:hypothetical protein